MTMNAFKSNPFGGPETPAPVEETVEEKPKTKTGLIVGGLVALCLVGGGVGAYFMLSGEDEPVEPPVVAAAAATTDSPTEEPAPEAPVLTSFSARNPFVIPNVGAAGSAAASSSTTTTTSSSGSATYSGTSGSTGTAGTTTSNSGSTYVGRGSTAGTVAGAKGEKGDKGDAGEAGKAGPRGPKGDQGLPGKQGDGVGFGALYVDGLVAPGTDDPGTPENEAALRANVRFVGVNPSDDSVTGVFEANKSIGSGTVSGQVQLVEIHDELDAGAAGTWSEGDWVKFRAAGVDYTVSYTGGQNPVFVFVKLPQA